MSDSIRFHCNACGKRLKAPPHLAGQRVKCGCGQAVVVPPPEPLPPNNTTSSPHSVRKRVPSAPVPLPLPNEPNQTPSSRHIWPWLVAGTVGVLLVVVLGVWWLILRDPGKRTPGIDRPVRLFGIEFQCVSAKRHVIPKGSL